MFKKAIFLFFVLFGTLVSASTNCPSYADSFEEYKAISRAALLEFLGNPEASKLSSAEVGDLSAFFERYQNNWNNANCNEAGSESGETIRQILEKYTSIIDTAVSCTLSNAAWSVGETVENTRVTLSVNAPRCDNNVDITFVVKENDFTTLDENVIENPESAKVINGIATTTWRAEWQEDIENTPSGPQNDNPPEYYFIASYYTPALGELTAKSGLLLTSECPDIDGDGYKDISCNGNDCDETSVDINPAANEICGNLVDENCNLEYDDGAVCGYDFAKRTIFTEAGNELLLKDGCIGDPDTDLFTSYLFPEAPLGNSSDNWDETFGIYDFNSDGIIDFEDFILLGVESEYAEADNDNYDTTVCHVDCRDDNPAINPGVNEICGDDIDNNCNGAKDEGGVCGYDLAKRTNFADPNSYVVGIDNCVGDPDLDVISVKTGLYLNPNLTGNGIYDLNGNGIIGTDDQFILIALMQGGDGDNDAYDTTICRKDCNDAVPAINPGVNEICGDDIDNNCNGAKDEGGVCGYDLAKRTNFADPNSYVIGTDGCIGDPDLDVISVKTGLYLNPNLTGNGIYDLNGDGTINFDDVNRMINHMLGRDLDNDAYDTTICRKDCNDAVPAINPGATEVCNDNKDNNCNGAKDEGGVCSYDLAKRTNFADHTSYEAGIDGCVGDPDLEVISVKAGLYLNPNLTGNGIYDLNGNGIIGTDDQFILIAYMEGGDGDNDAYDTTTCHGDCRDDNPAIKPGVTETCDNDDQNCDGYRDNAPNILEANTLTTLVGCDQDGACSGAVKTCDAGVWSVCSRLPEDEQESCNGIDDNCDGFIDNDIEALANTLSRSVSCGTGICSRTRNQVCDAGSWSPACVAGTAGTEDCDGLDNDCDGSVDEGISPTTNSCSQIGACSGAVKTCSDEAWSVCSIVGTEEVCNGVDDDCDGVIDDGVQNACGGCGTIIRGTPSNPCDGADTDSCNEGTLSCNAAKTNTICSDNTGNNVETCDGLDNDCDGVIDNDIEGLPYTLSQSVSCGTGICSRTQSQICNAGSWSPACVAGTAGTEDCDGLDNDCDGSVDEGISPTTNGCNCAGATRTCSAGVWSVCSIVGTEEVCNGVDDDCDGVDDNGFGCDRYTCASCGGNYKKICRSGCTWGSCTAGTCPGDGS